MSFVRKTLVNTGYEALVAAGNIVNGNLKCTVVPHASLRGLTECQLTVVGGIFCSVNFFFFRQARLKKQTNVGECFAENVGVFCEQCLPCTCAACQ